MTTDYRLPTDETDGKVSNQLADLYLETAARLGILRRAGDTHNAEYRELLAIYVTISIHALNRFYKP